MLFNYQAESVDTDFQKNHPPGCQAHAGERLDQQRDTVHRVPRRYDPTLTDP